MPSVNVVVMAGNLTQDPQLRRTETGRSVCNLRIAINESYTGSSGEKIERTCFVDVQVWERQADACAQYLRKGSALLVQGRLQLDEWTTPNGESRRRHIVHASRVQFLTTRAAEPVPTAAAASAAEEPF